MSNNFQTRIYFLLVVFTSLAELRKQCEPSLCNHEGQCFEENGQPTCQCVGHKYFRGPRCTELVDNCLEEPCENNGECLNLVGQFMCRNCEEGYGGLWCDIENENVFQNMLLYFNHYGYYSEEHKFLLLVEQRGFVNFSVELMGHNYVIDSFETNSRNLGQQWTYSPDLESLIRQNGIRYHNDLPFNKGYYHRAHEVFWHLGILTLSLRSYDTETATEFFHYQEFEILILPRRELECVPQLSFEHGFDPLEPLMLNIARFNTFEAVLQQHCHSYSNVVYEWQVFNTIGNKRLHDFGTTNLPLLKVAPYRFWFSYHSECFILVLPKPAKAVIAGGLRRQNGIAQNVLLDGSKSRDFALAPDALQDLFFNWSCVSLQEPGDEFCHKNMGTESKVSIKAGSLNVNNSYIFTLTVKSKVNILSSDKAQQEVHIVADHQLNVDIKCRRNCLRDEYVAGSMVHVEGICSQCPPEIKFYWTVNGVEQRENHRHFIYNPKNEETRLLIDLEVDAEAFKGHFSIEFQLNTPPSGGHCSIVPSAGTALETEFRIQCESYEDQDMPLEFHYFSGHFPLKRINEAQIILKLPESNTLTVLICDQWNACTETILDVDISALPRPSNFHEFLLANGTDPKGLFENSQRLTAFVLLKSIVSFVTTEDEANFVVDQVHNISLLTLLEIEQWLAISHDLVMHLRPLDYRKSLAVTKYIQKLRQGLQLIIEDQEIKYLNIERYQLAMHQIVDLMREFAKPWEPPMDIQTLMPETIMATDPLAEHYSELSDFDILIVEKIANWLELSKEVERIFQMFSSQATHIYQPKEPAFVINDHPCEMLLYAIDDASRQTIALGEPSMEVHLSPEAILDLQSLVKSHDLVIQVGSMGMNRFWWYPHELPISSDVLYFSTFPRLPPSSRLNSPLSIKFHLKISLANQEIQGKIKARQHMSMFTVEVPSHSLLVSKMHNLNSSISIGIGLGEKPTGFQMQQTISKLDASQLSSQKVHFAFNNNSHITEAYIAFLAQEGVSKFPLFFKFSVDIYQCLYWEWNMENPQWSSDGCRPKYNVTVNWQDLECECHHFSDFAARTYQPTVKEYLGEHWLLDHMPINWTILIFYIFSLLVFLTVLLINFRRIRNTRPILLSDAKPMEHLNLEIFIYTGSHWNSSSTSNIKFRFVSERGPYTLRIFQNPWKPQLLRNSIRQLLLDGQHVKFPFKIAISGDQSGRFPSWYCHRIIAHNHATKEKQIFLVNNWITQQPLEVMPSLSGGTWSERFHEHLSNFYINWFHFQPLWGPAKYNDYCSLQRSCIWVSQTFASVCIISCYYGPTTMDSYERDRDTYFYLRFKAGELFMLSSVCFFVSLFIKILFKIIITNI